MFIPIEHGPVYECCSEQQAFMVQLNRTPPCLTGAMTDDANVHAFTINTVAYAAIPS